MASSKYRENYFNFNFNSHFVINNLVGDSYSIVDNACCTLQLRTLNGLLSTFILADQQTNTFTSTQANLTKVSVFLRE